MNQSCAHCTSPARYGVTFMLPPSVTGSVRETKVCRRHFRRFLRDMVIGPEYVLRRL